MIHAHVVCAAIASGAADCAIVVDGDRAAAWQRTFGGSISIESEVPFGVTPAVTLDLTPPPPPDGARWTMARPFDAHDFLPCAKTTVRASLVGDVGVVWRGSIELPRRGCVSARVRPRVTCERSEVFFQPPSYDGAHPDPVFDHGAVDCTVSLGRAPAAPLHVYAKLDGTTSDAALTGADGGVELPADITTVRCGRGRVAVAITTAEGAPVWRGKATISCGELLHGIVND